MAKPHIMDLTLVSIIMLVITGINVGARFAEKGLVDEVIELDAQKRAAHFYHDNPNCYGDSLLRPAQLSQRPLGHQHKHGYAQKAL